MFLNNILLVPIGFLFPQLLQKLPDTSLLHLGQIQSGEGFAVPHLLQKFKVASFPHVGQIQLSAIAIVDTVRIDKNKMMEIIFRMLYSP